MLKILKDLKQSFFLVILIVILLCIQAIADLKLPDYTSKIVNNGIQSSGIVDTAPQVIRSKSMKELLTFLDNDEFILNKYTLISKDNLSYEDYEKYLKKYPILEKEDLYIQKRLKKDEQQELNNIIAKPMMILYSLTDEEISNKIKSQIIKNMPDIQKEKISNMDILDILKQMPKRAAEQIISEYTKQISNMPDSILSQASTAAIKKEYKEIGINTDNLQIRYILFSGIQMLGITLISMFAAILIILFSSRVAAKLGKTLREKIFRKVLRFSTKEFSNFSTASLITRSTNDIQQIQQLIAILFRVVVYAPIMGIGGFIKVLTQSDGSMSWIIGLAVGSIMLLVIVLFGIAMPKFKKLQTLIDKLNQVSREILTGLPVIRAFNKEKYEEKRFDESNKNLMKANIFVNRTMSIMMPMMMFVMNSIMILIIWSGGKNVDSGIMQVGDMMAFIQYTMQIVISFLVVSIVSIMLPRAEVSAKRIIEVLETEESIKDPKILEKPDLNKVGLVEFKNVYFKYPDAEKEILSNITFTAKPGETTAIIGSTGSGKSTIVNLIPRFYDVTNGELLVDGINVKNFKQKDLRNLIGFVPQKGLLFSGTIESNIKYSNENMTDREMFEAAEIAQAAEFINQKPEKYNSEIAQGGNNVSGGQRQRLSIARAIAKNPEIFIFDDSFSALDMKTDVKLREALSKKIKNKTIIIVAQRISTILNANQIIVLEEGKIVGKGNHNELMKNCETYRQIALSQLSEEELMQKDGDK